MACKHFIMKLSLTLHDKAYTVEDEIPFDAYSVDELLNMLKGLLVSAGYHPSTVDESIDSSDGNWFSQEELPEGYDKDNFDDKIEAGSNHETDPS